MPDPDATTRAAAGLLLVLAGPSGVGKTSIVHDLVRRFDGVFSVSATTRARTPSEREGIDYYFVDEATFQRMVDEDRFLEHAQVFGRSWYGTPEEPVRRQLADGRLVILDIDVQGAENVKRKLPEALTVFVLPPARTSCCAACVAGAARTRPRSSAGLRRASARSRAPGGDGRSSNSSSTTTWSG
jgi:guanylate kinase